MPSFGIERELFEQGYRRIAGVDEVGRGALAGLSAWGGGVSTEILIGPPAALLLSVNDSKKLTHAARLRASEHIHRSAVCVHTAMASHRTIDRLNVNGATEYLLSKIITELSEPPDVVIMDGRFAFSPGVALSR